MVFAVLALPVKQMAGEVFQPLRGKDLPPSAGKAALV
jgi:hypothetical protein